MGWLILAALALAVFVALPAQAAAGFSDIPQKLADATDSNVDTAKMMLSAMIIIGVIFAVGFALKDWDDPLLPMILAIVTTQGMLTAMDWLEPWLLILTAVLVAALFALRARGTAG